MEDSAEIIAARLVATREALGFDGQGGQSRFCEAIGVAKNIYNPFEKGSRRISLDVAFKIRREFNIPLDWIYCGDRAQLPSAIRAKVRQAA